MNGAPNVKLSRLEEDVAVGNLRPIRREDNAAMADVVRRVMTEFGCTAAGFSIHDPEVDNLFEAYSKPNCAYFVIEQDGVVIGGAGIAPLVGGDEATCELQKNYLLPACRGYSYGRTLFERCMAAAILMGFKSCYIETIEAMTAARAMYERAGFKPIGKAMGATGHFRCNCWYLKEW